MARLAVARSRHAPWCSWHQTTRTAARSSASAATSATRTSWVELAGGIDAWRAAGGTSPRPRSAARPTSAAERSSTSARAAEYAAGHVAGATHVELGALAERSAALPAGPLTVMCGHGERAATAASLLAATGQRDVEVLDGGPADWASATGEDLVRS